jgi:sulfate transport system permease protein
VTAAVLATNRPAPRRRSVRVTTLGKASGLGLGVAMIWFSLLVLIPLTAVVVTASQGGWTAFWATITNEQTAAAIKLTVGHALMVTAVNVVMGTLIAWVLVRDDFFGKRALEVLIDIPFALPTIVAGLALLTVYGPNSPLGVDLAYQRAGVVVALLFVTLPFVVRTVQPVLMELDTEMEQAAASLGARPATTFVRIILPNMFPAMAAGTALAFARSMSEFGSTVLISGNIPFQTQVASVHVYNQLESDNVTGAAAVSTILLIVSLVVLVALDMLQRWAARRG